MKVSNRKKILLTILIGLPVLIIAVLLFSTGAKYKNPYPYGTSIDNISDYLPDLPEESRDKLFYYLYNFIRQEEDTPTSGAVIRSDDFYLDEAHSLFIIDIESIKTSLRVTFWFENNSDTENSITFSCLPPEEQVYKEDTCRTSFTSEDSEVVWEHEYLLNYGTTMFSNRILSKINPFISSKNEASTAKNFSNTTDFFTATINERSFKYSQGKNSIIKSFIVTINDGREYKITIRIDSNRENYIAIVIQRNDLSGHDAGFIMSNKQQDIIDLTSWIKTYNSNITPEVGEF